MFRATPVFEPVESRLLFIATLTNLGVLDDVPHAYPGSVSVSGGTDIDGNPFFSSGERLYAFELGTATDMVVAINGTDNAGQDIFTGVSVSVYREAGNYGVLDAAERTSGLVLFFNAPIASGNTSFDGSTSPNDPLPTGRYLIYVEGLYPASPDGSDSASFDLTVDATLAPASPDADDTIAEANTSPVGGVFTSSIDTIVDVDVVAFSVTAGQKVAFDLDRTTGNLNSFLRIFDSTGAVLASNDNAAAPGETAGNDSYLTHTFASAGTYYVGVSSVGNVAYNVISGYGDNTGTTTGAYTLTLTAVTAPVEPEEPDSFAQIVNRTLVVTGTSGNDAMGVSAKKGRYYATLGGTTVNFLVSLIDDVAILGGDGNDRMGVGAGVPTAYLEGGAGKDRLGGGAGVDRLYSGTGNDIVDGGDGNDLIVTAGGLDYILGGAGDDRIYAGGGNDTVDAGAGRDRIYGGDGDDALSGSSGRDVLYGELGADTLSGGNHPDYGENDPADTRISIEVLL